MRCSAKGLTLLWQAAGGIVKAGDTSKHELNTRTWTELHQHPKGTLASIATRDSPSDSFAGKSGLSDSRWMRRFPRQVRDE